MIKAFEIRRISREYCIEYLHDHPEATLVQARLAVRERLSADFAESPFLDLLIQFAMQMLPLLIQIFAGREGT